MNQTMRTLTMITLTAITALVLSAPGMAFAKGGHASTTDSGKMTKLSNLVPAQANIVTVADKCYTTKEMTYSVTATSRKSAYPKCDNNYVVQKVNLKTEQTFLDVITKVSVQCCPQKTTWDKIA